METDNELKCKECGWSFPRDLINEYLRSHEVYCEKCGTINIKNPNRVIKRPVRTRIREIGF